MKPSRVIHKVAIASVVVYSVYSVYRFLLIPALSVPAMIKIDAMPRTYHKKAMKHRFASS